MFDERDKDRSLFFLREDLKYSDRKEVAKRLRELAWHKCTLPPDVVRSLADMIDPDKPQRLGPKPKGNVNDMRDYNALRVWLYVSSDKELARFIVHQEDLAFQLAKAMEDPTNWTENKFSPVWKHPDMSQERERWGYPLKDELKDYVCVAHGFSTRYLDTLISEERVRIAEGKVPDWIP